VRAKLREDLMYVAVEDGVYLETGLASASLTGAAAFRLLQRLAPHLDGGTTVEALTAGLPPAQQRLVHDMVTMLVQRGIARDLDAEPPHGLQEWEIERYGEAIAFAEHIADAPLNGFERFRNSKVLIIGEGQTLVAALKTLFQLGLRSATLHLEAAGQPAAQTLQACLRIAGQHRERDPAAELALAAADADLAELIAAHDAVLHCADRRMAQRALTLTRMAHSTGVPVMHALPAGQEAWIGPTGSGQAAACWECFLSHLVAAGRQVPFGDEPAGAPAGLSGPISALAGAALAFDFLRHRLIAGSPASHMVRIDLDTAQTGQHQFGRHPRCHSCQPRPSTAARMAQRTPTGVEAFAASVPLLVDPVLGPVLCIGTAHHSQLMVSCIEASVVDPQGAHGAPVTVSAVATSRKQALTRAAAAAIELLAVPATADPWCDWKTGETVTVRGGKVVVAAGFTWAEACGRAALRLRRPAEPSAVPPADDRRWLDRTTWPLDAKIIAADLALMGHELVAWWDSPRFTVFVGTGAAGSCEEILAYATATEIMTAIGLAVPAAAAALTGRPARGAEVGPDLGEADWDEILPVLLEQTGLRLAVRPADGLPAIRQAMPFLVQASFYTQHGESA
jgi:bacteriocin biosynthesis cyclodehydratase domain-containing protein